MLTVLFRLPVFLQEQGFFLPLTVLRQTTRGLALKFLQGRLKAVSEHMALPSVSLSETQLFINLEISKGFFSGPKQNLSPWITPFPSDTFSMDFLAVTYLAAASRDQESLFCFLFVSAHFPGDAIYPGALSAIHTLLTPNKSSAYCLFLRLTVCTWLSAGSFLCLSVMMSLHKLLLESPQLSKCQLALWRYIVPPIIV